MAKVTYDKCPFTGRLITRPSLKLIGAKTKQRALIYQFFPNYYTEYHEIFLGTGGVLIEEPRGVTRIGYDINEDVISYYKILRDKSELFWSIVSYEIDMVNRHNKAYVENYSAVLGRDFFNGWKNGYHAHENLIWKANYFYMITKCCMNGIWRKNKLGKVNSSYCKTVRGRGLFDKEWFDKVVNLIQNSSFRHCSFQDAISQVENSGDLSSFMFLDPPYRYKNIKDGKGCVTVYNGDKFLDVQHQELADLLRGTNKRWLLTINDDDWIKKLYRGFDIVDRKVFYTCSQTTAGRGERDELLIANYDISSRAKEIFAEYYSKKLLGKSKTLQDNGGDD